MAASPQGASGGKGGAAAGGAEVMEKAELKQVLMLAKRKSVSCAIAMSKNGQAVLLLDKRVKPKKLVAELKRSAKEKSIELEISTLRFGRAAVDENSSVQFTVNKESPGALRMKVLERLKPAGFPKCQIGVDEKLESEADDDEPGSPASGEAGGGASRGEAAHSDAGATGGGETGGGAAHAGAGSGDTGAGDTGGAKGGGEATSAGSHAGAGDTGGGRATGPTGDAGGGDQTAPGAGAAATDGAGSGAGGKGGLKDRMRGLLQKIGTAMGANPAGSAGLVTMAKAAIDAMKSGDMAGAAKAADTLEKALGGGATDGAATDGGTPDGGRTQTAYGNTEAGAGATTAGAGATTAPGDAAAGDTAGDSTAGEPTGAGSSSGNGAPAGNAAPGQQSAGADTGANTGAATPPVAANSQTPPMGTGSQQRGQHGSPVFDKARQTWDAVRAKVQRDIDGVMKQFEGELGQGSEDAKMIRECFEPILKGLDDSLSKKLADVAKNSEPAGHGKLVQEAQAIITKYIAYIDGEPMVTELDKNPVQPVAVRKTLDAALATLSKALGASGQAAPAAPAAARAA